MSMDIRVEICDISLPSITQLFSVFELALGHPLLTFAEFSDKYIRKLASGVFIRHI